MHSNDLGCVASQSFAGLTFATALPRTFVQVAAVTTITEAMSVLRGGGSSNGWGAVVAALGVDRETYLFNDGYGDRSDLITTAK